MRFTAALWFLTVSAQDAHTVWHPGLRVRASDRGVAARRAAAIDLWTCGHRSAFTIRSRSLAVRSSRLAVLAASLAAPASCWAAAALALLPVLRACPARRRAAASVSLAALAAASATSTARAASATYGSCCHAAFLASW